MKQSTGRLLRARQLSRQSALGIGMAAAVAAGISACGGSSSNSCHYVPQAIGVFGQPDFISYTANYNGVTTSSLGGVEGSVATIDLPTPSPLQNSPLFIADTTNNRILMYTGLPTVPPTVAESPSYPLANPLGPGANSSNSAIVGVGSVAPPADAILGTGTAGQGTVSGGALTQIAFSLPTKVQIDATGTVLVVTDTGNNRVLIYNTVPTLAAVQAGTALPDVVVGQPDFTASTPNNGLGSADPLTCTATVGGAAAAQDSAGSPSQCNLDEPTAAFITGGSVVGGVLTGATLIVADKGNNRVLIFPYPLVNSAGAAINSASVVLGQNPAGTCSQAAAAIAAGNATAANSVFTCNTPNIDTYNGTQYTLAMNEPSDVWSDGSLLLITDSGNQRVLSYQSIPAVNDALPQGLIGEPQFGETTQTGATGTQGLHYPSGVGSDGTNVFIADTYNNRVLEFNGYVSSAIGLNPAASEVFGQADFTHVTQDDPDQNSVVGDQRNDPATNGVTAGTMYYPQAVYASANLNALYVTDTNDSRVLQFTITSDTPNGTTGVNGSDPQDSDYCY